MARVVLINPPSADWTRAKISSVIDPPPPYGLASIAGQLRRAGHQIKIIDAVKVAASPTQAVAESLLYKADFIGLSVLGSAIDWSQAFCNQLRKKSSATIVAGNALATEYPDWFFEQIPECDAIVLGEGEKVLLELVEATDPEAVPGTIWKNGTKNQAAKQIQDLDSLAYPAWDLIPYSKYNAPPQLLCKSMPMLGVLQSRGCPWSCSYCAQNFLWNKIRFASIERVAEEIDWVHKSLGIQAFGFFDSIFPQKPEYGEQLYREFEKRKLLGKIRMTCETRTDLVWADTYRWLKKAGMHLVFLGIETHSASLLQQQKKNLKDDDIYKPLATLRKLGLRTYGLFMIGFPNETKQDRAALAKFSQSLPLDVASFGIYQKYAGSPSARSAKDIDPRSLSQDNWADPNSTTLAKSQQELMQAFYLRPSQIARILSYGDIKLSKLISGASKLLVAPKT